MTNLQALLAEARDEIGRLLDLEAGSTGLDPQPSYAIIERIKQALAAGEPSGDDATDAARYRWLKATAGWSLQQRVFGLFASVDVFIGTNFQLRNALGRFDSIEWKAASRLARHLWRELFNTDPQLGELYELVTGAKYV